MTDLQALERYAQTQDADAFRHLVMVYKDVVYAVCMRRLRNTTDVEDAVQETFLKLARRADDIRQNVGGWLCAAANTTALDMIKAGAARRKHEYRAAEQAVRVSEPDPQATDWPEISQQLDDALQALPAEDRDLIVQYFFLGRTQKQMAEEMGLVQSTVKRRVDRVVKGLRGQLAGRGLAALSVGALVVCLQTQAKAQAPIALTAALTKIGVAGFGAANAGLGGAAVSTAGAGATATATTAAATGSVATGGGMAAALSSTKVLLIGGAALVAGVGLTATVALRSQPSAPPTAQNPAGPVASTPAVDLSRILSPLKTVRVPAQNFLAVEHVIDGNAGIVAVGETIVPRILEAIGETGAVPIGALHSLNIREAEPGSTKVLMTIGLPIMQPVEAPAGLVLFQQAAHQAVEAEWYGSMLLAEQAVEGFYDQAVAAGYDIEPVFAFVHERFVGVESDENVIRIRAALNTPATTKSPQENASSSE